MTLQEKKEPSEPVFDDADDFDDDDFDDTPDYWYCSCCGTTSGKNPGGWGCPKCGAIMEAEYF